VLSNRLDVGAELPHIVDGPGQTTAVSNAPFGDRSWPKVPAAEKLLEEAIRQSTTDNDSKQQLIDKLFQVLDNDTMPGWDGKEEWKKYTRRMEGTILLRKIPLLGPQSGASAADGVATPLRRDSPISAKNNENNSTKSGTETPKGQRGYGTTKQTIVLVSKEGKVTYVERTLWDEHERSVPEGERDRTYEFDVEAW
jgi:uncharacterized protein with NRDE domain